MRRNLTLGIFLLVTILAVTGCETEPILFKGEYHVRFSSDSDFRKESSTAIVPIEIHLVGPAHEEDISISYTISGNAREGIDYTIEDERGKITIPAGEYFGYINVQLINNANNILRSQEIIFTLKNASGDLAIGQGESAMGKTFTFTILDDCILGGTYTAEQGNTTIEGVAITSPDCEVYTLSNWNIGVFNSDTEMNLTFIENNDYTLTIPLQEEENIDPEFATIEGSGFRDPITGTITFNITLVDILDDNDEPEEIQITLQRE